jgi:ribosomal protein S18 acetylase RimI-like enzyme
MKTALKPVSQSRPLASSDLAAVVAIDAALCGRSRRDYFERRLAAAKRDPQRHLQLAVDQDGSLAGFMLGRSLEGEFGRSEPGVRLEAFGVSLAAQGHGLASALAAAFEADAAKRGLQHIRTTALWREHELLWFLDRMRFRLAGSHVLDCPLDPHNDFEPLARDAAEVRLLKESDLEGIARIDRRATGRERRGYLCRSFAETLADSALRVSLAAHADGALAGFVMARLDYGDFGRAEPAAVIDTIGVDPLRARQGIGRALLSQLFLNLRALRVERVETVVEPGNLDLMGFFYAAGFRPSERLSFVKPLA